MIRPTSSFAAASLALGCWTVALAQPPAAPEQPVASPDQVCLTNACSKPATNRPPAPMPDRPSNTTLLPKAAQTLEQMIAQQDGFRATQDGPAPPPEMQDQVRNMVFGVSQHASLMQAGLPTATVLPDGMGIDVQGAVWLADGGFLPPGTSSVTREGGFVTTTNVNTGGPNPYGSATSYIVNGDMISINKGIRIGDQPMVMANLQVRSGETATVRLPDGSIFQVTPTLRPLTQQEVRQNAVNAEMMAKTRATPPARP